MNFEAIPLYSKIILGPAKSEEVRNVTNKHVLQKQKKICLENQKRHHKMYGTCQGKRVPLKNEIKELEMTKHVCYRKYVCFTKDTYHFG